MDSASPEPWTLSIPPRTNGRSAKRKGRKEKKKKKEEEGELWNVLEFGGKAGKKKGGKKDKKEKSKGMCVEEKKRGKKREK